MLGDMIDAAEALRLGLVNYVVPAAELEPRLQNVLAKLRDLSAAALAMTRSALDLGAQNNFQAVLTEIENLYLHELMKTEDAHEGVRSFMEKRKPEWHHR
jgi:enoyl-CoA hydratase/carnithine racemase